MKYLLIPVNFDENGAGVITYGVALAKALNLKVRLLHVLTVPGIPSPIEAHAGSTTFNVPTGELIEERKNQAEQKLKALSERITQKSNLNCEFVCEHGFVDIQVLEQSEEDQVAMVVMGSPARDTILNQLMGSRSFKIVNHTEVPVLLVPNLTAYLPIKQMVVGVNYEQFHNAKNQWLEKVSRKLSANLHFVRVASSKTKKEELTFDGYKKQITLNFPKQLDAKFKLVVDDSVESGLRDYARLNHGDLIAVQRSEKSTWDHLFSEKVSKDLAFSASIPVLIY